MLNKIVIAPDKFKGSMSAKRIREILSEEILAACPDCEIVEIPVADGGEGSIEAILSVEKGEIVHTTTVDPYFKEIDSYYGVMGDVAIMEMATTSGLALTVMHDTMIATTYGFGQQIKAALEKGYRKFLLCIGGSATTDGGCGMATALGVKFYDEEGELFTPTGGTLCKISKIDVSGIDERTGKSQFTVISDVKNPLYGEYGAARVYSAQKGATEEEIDLLDNGLRHLANLVYSTLGADNSIKNGSGAAGGLGYGCITFLKAKIEKGIEVILRLSCFDSHIRDADLIVTGEGKLDKQSFMGKVIDGIVTHGKGKPLVVLCGVNTLANKFLKQKNITVYEFPHYENFDDAVKNSEQNLRNAARQMMVSLDK